MEQPSLQPVADQLVDFDHRREIVCLPAANAIDLLHHPNADRDDSGSELVRQLIVRVVEVLMKIVHRRRR